jgi:hypothetical protein
MFSRKLKAAAGLILLLVIMSIALPIPAGADGGPVVPYDLWENLREGQQVAVVTILNQSTAKVDLFISILDKTNQSHEVVFFVPVGTSISDFYVVEQEMTKFDQQVSGGLDDIIRQTAEDRQHAVQVLFSGALLTNGALLIPLWAPVLLTGCAAAEPQPEATFETESSQISIFGIDENTDLDALIKTTGLPGSVADTLSKLKDQQIAVVKLQTHPQSTVSAPSARISSELGIHLSWHTAFVSINSRPTYTYPLGTGGSWSKPIELTRVYIHAPKGMDFDVEYPAIGSDQSGIDLVKGSRINSYFQTPSYAVDEARGKYGHTWRATYTQSNPTEDIIIVAKPQSAFSQFQQSVQESAIFLSFFFALVIGLLVWLLAWHYLMPRFLGDYSAQQARLRWYFALIYPGINAVFIIFPGSILYLIFLVGLPVPSLIVTFFILGGVTIGMFALVHAGHLGVSRSKAMLAFIWTSLAGSGAYLVLALILALIIGII